MNGTEIFWNNIASLALIPIVIGIVRYLKNAQIETLKEEVELLKMLRVSEVEEDFKALKRFYKETKKKEAGLKETLTKMAKKLSDKGSLSKEQMVDIVRLFQQAIGYLGLIPHNKGYFMMGDISSTLYHMEGPIGDLWRDYVDREKRETLRKLKEREPDNSK